MRAVTIRIPTAMWDALRSRLLGSRQERFSYLLARATDWTDPWGGRGIDLVVRRAIPVPDVALTAQSTVRVEVDPAFTHAVLIACFESGMSLIDVHTHPFSGASVAFSSQDLDNMAETHAQFLDGIPQDPPAVAASLVLGTDGVAGAWLDPDQHEIRPLKGLELVGSHRREVALCSP